MSIAEREAAYESYTTVRPNIVQQAVMLCKDQRFHRYIERRKYYVWDTCDEKQSRNVLCEICGIKSRAELATNDEAAVKFEALLKDFQRDCAQRAVA